MTFDPHDPDIEAMMWERAHAQGAAHNAETVLGTRVVVGSPRIDGTALLNAIEEYRVAFEAAMGQVAEVISTFGESLSRVVADIEAAQRPDKVNRTRHGHAAICPRHGPTTGGLCRRCAR